MKKISKISIATILLVSSLTIMVGSVIAPALPAISKSLNFNFNPGLLVTLPSLGVVLFSPFVGKLINKLGPFKLICLGLLPYAIFGFIGYLISNTYLLVLDRLLLGAACVAIQVSVTTYIAELFEGEQRLKMIAWQGMAIELGGVVFLSLGGYLGELSWYFPFYIYLLAIPYLLLVYKFLPHSTSSAKYLQTDNEDKTSHKNPIFKPIFLGSFFSMAIFFVAYVSLPQYLPEKFNFTESETGYFMSAISLIAVIIAGIMPKIAKKITPNLTVCLGFIFFAVGYILFAATSELIVMYLGIFFTGLGFGLTVPLLNHMVVENSTKQNRGKNLGFYSMMVFAGQFFSSFVEFLPIKISFNFYYTAIISLIVSICLFILFRKTK
ncbi:MFS transporter [Mesonia sp.]|uniref:MFS transporter n=1 Tax=Mesonia sp. TaxID=1960830 RepID=UPI0017566A09|nr:MFS transporter [Mesonia sp.]HIB36499.1 MFS transporter [Mesonia sp.]HIO26641.1 MFS transporter [Flavobacteriaceae bacterium]